jgi:quercetin dioxygenase-like cupin family protein
MMGIHCTPWSGLKTPENGLIAGRTAMTMAKITPKGPDPAKVASHVYKKIMENQFVRVLDVRFKPGDRTETHWHPNHVAYVLEGGSVEITPHNGKTQKVPMKTGEVVWMDSDHHHASNEGKSDIHALIIELKGNTKKLGK